MTRPVRINQLTICVSATRDASSPVPSGGRRREATGTPGNAMILRRQRLLRAAESRWATCRATASAPGRAFRQGGDGGVAGVRQEPSRRSAAGPPRSANSSFQAPLSATTARQPPAWSLKPEDPGTGTPPATTHTVTPGTASPRNTRHLNMRAHQSRGRTRHGSGAGVASAAPPSRHGSPVGEGDAHTSCEARARVIASGTRRGAERRANRRSVGAWGYQVKPGSPMPQRSFRRLAQRESGRPAP